MSHIILGTSLACLIEKKINKKKKANAKLIRIKLENEYFWIFMSWFLDTVLVGDLNEDNT